MSLNRTTCAECGTSITEVEPGVWIDYSLGDTCWTDEPTVHTPYKTEPLLSFWLVRHPTDDDLWLDRVGQWGPLWFARLHLTDTSDHPILGYEGRWIQFSEAPF